MAVLYISLVIYGLVIIYAAAHNQVDVGILLNLDHHHQQAIFRFIFSSVTLIIVKIAVDLIHCIRLLYNKLYMFTTQSVHPIVVFYMEETCFRFSLDESNHQVAV